MHDRNPVSYITDRLLIAGAKKNGFYIVPLSKQDVSQVVTMLDKDEVFISVTAENLYADIKYNKDNSSPTLLNNAEHVDFWLVAREYKTGKMIGFISYALSEYKTLLINSLAVMAEHRYGKKTEEKTHNKLSNVGSFLVGSALAHGRWSGAKICTLFSLEDEAIPFYKHLGFSQVKPSDLDMDGGSNDIDSEEIKDELILRDLDKQYNNVMQKTFHKTGLKQISSVVEDSSGPVVVQERPRSFLSRTTEEELYTVTPLEQFQKNTKELKK